MNELVTLTRLQANLQRLLLLGQAFVSPHEVSQSGLVFRDLFFLGVDRFDELPGRRNSE